MAGIKRKQSASSGTLRDNVKKRKQGGDPAVESSASSNPEAETDSDPIIESDTTEHSGDNDGVSWPSDDEQMQEEIGEDKSHANGHQSTAPAATTNGVSSRSSNHFKSPHMLIFTRLVQGIPCQTKSLGPRTKGCKTKRRFYSQI